MEIVSKSQWGGRNATYRLLLRKKLNYVIIHHSATPTCLDREKCSERMRSIQEDHMDRRDWSDIAYHYAIGSNGEVYEGRGVGVLGGHATNWNRHSYGVVFIGDYENNEVNSTQVTAWQSLIKWMVDQEYLTSNYTLYGHRQVRATKCPGEFLYNTLQTWPHWQREVKKP